ncbi:unnamed protein product, partial [Scytosiphon promiscuus]
PKGASFGAKAAPAKTSATALSAKSKALPFLESPATLDGSMIGDFGFDPLGLTENIDLPYGATDRGDQARTRGDACRRGILADAVRAPPRSAVPGGAAGGAHHRARRGPGPGFHFHRYLRDGIHHPGVQRKDIRPLGDPRAGPERREGFLQEERGRAGEAEAVRDQALAPGDARHHGRAHTDDDVPQALSGLLSSFS